MSKAFIAQVIQESAQLDRHRANRTAGDVVAAIVRELKKNGRFTLPALAPLICSPVRGLQALPASSCAR